MDKSELRVWAKKLRKTLDIEQISQKICQNIKDWELYKKSKNIMIFYPLPDEINLLSLLDDDKTFYLPRVNGHNMEVCPYKKGDRLIKSELKIMEPLTEPINKSVLDIVFTPALCVDKDFHRIGYGGGFYDRFCKNENRKYKIWGCTATHSYKEDGILRTKFLTVIPEELIVEDIPTESHDIKCDGIITQKKASFRG